MNEEKCSSVDSDDAYAPFLLTQAYQEEISAITSPAFEPTVRNHSNHQVPSSLASRLSRCLSSSEKISSAPTPSKHHFDALSTIQAEEDSICDKASEDGSRWRRYNGEVMSEHKIDSPELDIGRGFDTNNGYVNSTPNRLMARYQNDHDHSARIDTTKDSVSRIGNICFGEANNASPIPVQTSVLSQDDTGSSTSSSSNSFTITQQSQDEKKTQNHNGKHDKSLSWEISPAKDWQGRYTPKATASSPNDHCRRLEVSMTSTANDSIPTVAPSTRTFTSEQNRSNSSKPAANEWREVSDPETGRTYYYNRCTRISKWKLPKGAILVKKVSNRSFDRSRSTGQQSQVTSTPQKSATHQPKTRQDTSLAMNSSFEDEHSVHQSYPKEEKNRGVFHVSYSADETQLSIRKHSPESYDQDQSTQPSLYEITKLNDTTFETRLGSVEVMDEMIARQNSPGNIKSPPQDQDYMVAIFCAYCGLKCGSAVMLGAHLPKCEQFSTMQLHGMSTQMELESILFRAWSQMDNATKLTASNVEYSEDLSSSRELVRHDVVAHVSSCSQEPNDERRDQSFRSRSDSYIEDDTCGNDLQEAVPKTPRASRNANLYSVEQKKCPFCQDEFTKGNEFSSHLLNCTARRRARTQRRKQKKESPVATDPRIRKCATPGRRMPWE